MVRLLHRRFGSVGGLSKPDTVISNSTVLHRIACDLCLRGVCGRPTVCTLESSQPRFVTLRKGPSSNGSHLISCFCLSSISAFSHPFGPGFFPKHHSLVLSINQDLLLCFLLLHKTDAPPPLPFCLSLSPFSLFRSLLSQLICKGLASYGVPLII